MASIKSLILKMKWIFYLLIMALSILSCVTVTPQTVSSMSDQFLCEMLGPEWISTSEEQRVIRDELDRRGVLCDYGQIVGYRGEQRKKPSDKIEPHSENRTSTGTGFAVNESGTLITAFHIVDGAKKIEVMFSEGNWKPAILVRYSRSTDVAILKIAESSSVYLSLKSTNTIKPGDSVFNGVSCC